MVGELTDVARLVTLPVFAYAAWHDHRHRRVPNKLWLPILAVALLTLVVDAAAATLPPGPAPMSFVAPVFLSVFVAIPLAFLGWFQGLFGGGDAKAIMVIALLFPAAPAYELGGWSLPLAAPKGWPFVALAVVNGLIVALVYMAHVALRNALAGNLSPRALYAHPVASADVPDRFGIVLSPSGGSTAMEYIGIGGVDAVVLREYREWRGIDDGQGWEAGKRRRESGGDPWGSQRFIADAGQLYGVTPQALRETLEYLAREDRVWFSPAVPYVVPLVVGLVLALTVGFLPAVVL
jgi:preflagellin peptidase FlaK